MIFAFDNDGLVLLTSEAVTETRLPEIKDHMLPDDQLPSEPAPEELEEADG